MCRCYSFYSLSIMFASTLNQSPVDDNLVVVDVVLSTLSLATLILPFDTSSVDGHPICRLYSCRRYICQLELFQVYHCWCYSCQPYPVDILSVDLITLFGSNAWSIFWMLSNAVQTIIWLDVSKMQFFRTFFNWTVSHWVWYVNHFSWLWIQLLQNCIIVDNQFHVRG